MNTTRTQPEIHESNPPRKVLVEIPGTGNIRLYKIEEVYDKILKLYDKSDCDKLDCSDKLQYRPINPCRLTR